MGGKPSFLDMHTSPWKSTLRGYHSETCGPLVAEGDVHYLPAVDKFQNPPIKSAQQGGEQDPVEKANNLAEVAGERWKLTGRKCVKKQPV